MPPLLSQADLAVYYDGQLREHQSDHIACLRCHIRRCPLWREAYANRYGRVTPMDQPMCNDGEVNWRVILAA